MSYLLTGREMRLLVVEAGGSFQPAHAGHRRRGDILIRELAARRRLAMSFKHEYATAGRISVRRPRRRAGAQLSNCSRSPPPLRLQQHPNSRRLHRPPRVSPVAQLRTSLDSGPFLGKVCRKPTNSLILLLWPEQQSVQPLDRMACVENPQEGSRQTIRWRASLSCDGESQLDLRLSAMASSSALRGIQYLRAVH